MIKDKAPKPYYQFLPKTQRNRIDTVSYGNMLTLLEVGEVESFGFILGIIADLKMKTGIINEDHQKILNIPKTLLTLVEEHERS